MTASFEWRFVDRDGVLVHSETHAQGAALPGHTRRFGKDYKLTSASAKMHEAEYREIAPGGVEVG